MGQRGFAKKFVPNAAHGDGTDAAIRFCQID
jgi:hypothetical protein